ncbi:RNA polymerase subunit sigma [bacterium]|nr:RNA polymerase subunit sigma [bacterium]MBU1072981.1 RNA polymerase subunit sigma [bacterium]MBU1677037.1 RNA polymerase subunit sigma [bacterium]
MQDSLNVAARILRESRHAVAFTGAGVSVESGIPAFRGPDGIWSRYDPATIELGFFLANPRASWLVIKEIFYDFFGRAEPNAAHVALADLERAGVIREVITQNIDNLHQEAGSRRVWEFHGNSRLMVCLGCGRKTPVAEVSLDDLPPRCDDCAGLLKPDFIFFGEGIPEPARSESFRAAEACDVMLVIGSTGEVAPASLLPGVARNAGATIIEINPEPSLFTDGTTGIFLQGKATAVMTALARELWDGGHRIV